MSQQHLPSRPPQAEPTSPKQLATDIRELLTLLYRTGPNGARVFSNEDIEQVLPIFVMPTLGPGDSGRLSADLRSLLARFALRVGLHPTLPVAERHHRLAAYFEAHPPNPALVAELNSFARKHSTWTRSPAALKQIEQMLGQSTASNGTAKGLAAPSFSTGAGLRPRSPRSFKPYGNTNRR